MYPKGSEGYQNCFPLTIACCQNDESDRILTVGEREVVEAVACGMRRKRYVKIVLSAFFMTDV